jgi:DNA-binding transcriptional ArsR family regulator/uncharacterized protein YndB with AHSA1/START domain
VIRRSRGRPRLDRAEDDGTVWRALADPTRRRLLDLLRDGPRTTGDLAATFDVTRFAVMQHLEVLAAAGLVRAERRGRERWNHLNPVPLRAAYERWMAPYAESAAVSVLRLKAAAERAPGPSHIAAQSSGTEGSTTVNTDLATEIGRLDVSAEVIVERDRDRVFDTLLAIGDWWPHRFRDGSTVVLEPRPGGSFCEEFPGEGGAVYGTVSFLERPEKLSVSGPMGLAGAVAATWTISLTEESAGRTRLTLTHSGFGDIDDETRESYAAGWPVVLAALDEAARS